MIEIMKASAGSGKTHLLTEKYIRLLLESKDRHEYRHILAVTFTNKATEEMKSRILKELHTLSSTPEKSPYFAEMRGLYPDVASLQEAASTLLFNILHDYGAFAVSTIDKFFQQVLKSFSRELGHFSAYQLELDRKALISEAVVRVLDSLTTEKKDERLVGWLTDNALSSIEDGKGFNLEKSVTAVAERILSEEHRAKAEACGLDPGTMYDDNLAGVLSEICDRVETEYLEEISSAVEDVYDAFAEDEVDPKDTYRGFIDSALRKFRNIDKDRRLRKNLLSDPLNATFTSRCGTYDADPRGWFTAGNKALASKISQRTVIAVTDFAGCFGERLKLYRTSRLIKSQVYGMGLANDLSRTFAEMLKEKNVLSLDDSNTILKGIIDGTDAPFIYEKMGVRFEHFLLDEFQDTSRIQWDNFKPLLANSDAQGFYNLIVGDVKQSIYRWRGSDWNLIKSEIAKDFSVSENSLKQNWRSSREIIEFNNAFFSSCARRLDAQLGVNEIREIYADVIQDNSPSPKLSGGVDVIFCPEDEDMDVLQRENAAVRNCVEEALASGFRYSDIAVLVRGKAEGAQLAAYLVENNIPVLTDDSMMILSSSVVRQLVALLSSIDNPADEMSGYLSGLLDVELPEEYHSLMDLCEQLLRSLRDIDSARYDEESIYIQSFMDKVKDFQSRGRDGLHAFLASLEGDKSSISSPSVGNSVRVITIHKSKGLAFPFVIVPFAEKINLFKAENSWCRPDVEGTELAEAAAGIYDVKLSGKSEGTYFEGEYREEQLKQAVDNINVAYVAFTRARYQLRIVAAQPSASFLSAYASDRNCAVKDFSELLYAYTDSDDRVMECSRTEGFVADKDDDEYIPLQASYESWPLGERLVFSRDSSDFFSDSGETGFSASRRIRGVVLHGILSETIVPDDLPGAVSRAVEKGLVPAEDAPEVLAELSERVEKGRERGWFPSDASLVRNEVTLMDTDGSLLRPDRVVEDGEGGLFVIDYKFGEQKPSYKVQVGGYADMFRRMGYTNVQAAIWYVDSENVVYL